MNKTIKRDKIFLLFIVGLIFTGSFGIQCARPSSPIGGPKDTIPPIILKMSPANYLTNLYPDEIMFEFNEFMQLKDQQKEIVISPPLKTRPIFELRGKKVYTKFSDNVILDSNTTYHIDYGRALADLNEGNYARQIKFVFSTGDKIDSLSMSGQAIDAKTGDTVVNALVYLFEPILDSITIDSTLFNGNILAMAKTDSSGIYFATNLKGENYRVYVVEDTDNNGLYTVGKDRVGFIDSTLNPLKLPMFDIWFDPVSRQVFASPQVTFRMFKEEAYLRQKLEEVIYVNDYKFLVKFAAANAPIDTIIIENLDGNAMLNMYSAKKDSLTVWVKTNGYNVPDTLKGIVRYMGIDSIGKPILIDEKFEVLSKILTADDEKEIKKAERMEANKHRTPWWQRVLNWFRFKFNRDVRLAARKILIERQRVYDSLRNNPEALLKLRLDSLRLDSIRLDSLVLDSIRLDSINRFKLDSLNVLRVNITPSMDFNPNKKIYIKTDYPLDVLNLDSVKLYKYAKASASDDSFDESAISTGTVEREKSLEKLVFERDSLDYTKHRLITSWVEDAEYEFNIVPGAMIDILGKTNDTIKYKVSTVQSRKMTIINVIAENVDKCYIMELVHGGSSVEYTHIVNKDSVYNTKLLPVGKYKIKITKDDNCNGVFDDGNLVKRIMPEEIAFYVGEKGVIDIDTKANFEFDFTIDFKSLFSKKVLIVDSLPVDSLSISSEPKLTFMPENDTLSIGKDFEVI